MQETTPRRYNLVEDEDKLSVSLLEENTRSEVTDDAWKASAVTAIS